MLVQSDLNKIEDIKKNIHTSIKNKGVDIPNDTPFEEYAEKVDSIKGGTTPDDIKLVKFNIDPYQITDQVTMHVTGAISVYKNVAVVEKGATITYYASCEQYEDTTPQTVTVNTDMAIMVTLHKSGVIYGFSIDQTNSNPRTCVSYIKGCDNENYNSAWMDFTNDSYKWGSWREAFFVGKPCMLKSDGTVDYYLDPDDYSKKTDGTASDIKNDSYDGNVMVEFPAIFTKYEQVGTTINVYISNVKVDNDYEAWNCKRDDGTYNEYFYISAYPRWFGAISLSRSNKNCGYIENVAIDTEIVPARANGAGWDVAWWSDMEPIRLLFYLMHKGLNSRGLLGYGDNSRSNYSGSCDTKGLCYGRSYASALSVKFLGIEKLYGFSPILVLGLLKSTNYLVKMTKGTQDGSTVQDFNGNGTGYIDTNISYTTIGNRFISSQTANNYGMFPTASNASDTTYYCDYVYNTNSDVRIPLLFGGPASKSNGNGISYMDISSSYNYITETTFLSYHKP